MYSFFSFFARFSHKVLFLKIIYKQYLDNKDIHLRGYSGDIFRSREFLFYLSSSNEYSVELSVHVTPMYKISQ